MYIRRTNRFIIGIMGLCLFFALIEQASAAPGPVRAEARCALLPAELPPPVFASGAVDRLRDDVAKFDKVLNTYIVTGQKLDGDIQIVLKGLDLVEKMGKDLQNLDNALTTVEKLLPIAEAIPQTEEQAKSVSAGIAKIHPSVTRASDAVNNFNAKVAPARKNLEEFDSKLQKLISAAQTFERRLNVYTADIAKADECVSSLPAGSAKEAMQTKLDQLANASDKRVLQATKLLTDIIAVLNDVKQVIDQEVRVAMEPLYDLETEIENLYRNIKALINPLHELKALFSKSFSVSFKYPSPTWKDPFREKTCTIDIGFETILKGAGAIESEMKHLLSNELFKVAKWFGIEKLVKELESKAQDELKDILKDLHLDFKVEIPGLDNMPELLNALDKAMGDLVPKLTLDTQPFEGLLNDLENDIHEMENIYQNCK